MLQTFTITLVQMLRLFALMAIGFLLNRCHIISKECGSGLSKLTVVFFAPALVFYTFIVQCTKANLSQNFSYVIYGFVILMLGTVATSYPLCNFFTKDPYQKSIYRYAIAMPNTGGFATPLVLAFFGIEGNFLKTLFLFTATIITYTWGTAQLIPSGRPGIRGMLKRFLEPNFVALVIGAILGLAGGNNWIPKIILDNISFFGDCYVPFSLLVVGFCIGDFNLKEIAPNFKTLGFTVMRMVCFPLVFIFGLYLVHAPRMVILLAALAFSSPCGMNTVVFPMAYGKDCREGSRLVVFTSLMAVVIMPLIYSIAIALVGEVI